MKAIEFHVMAKPVGPLCNLACTYCYYLPKQSLLARSPQMRMSDATLELFTRQYLRQPGKVVHFAWQGGEPTLAGIGFFEKALTYQKTCAVPGRQITNDLQTNGTLLDDEWCRFLQSNHFLVGLSIDGPRDLHDAYRRDRLGNGSFSKVARAAQLLQSYGIPFNTLTVVNNINARHPLKVYRFLRDEVGARHIQFIPCVEPRDFASRPPTGGACSDAPTVGQAQARPNRPDSIVTDWSVGADEYGEFMCTVFDEWAGRDAGRVFVRDFEVMLARWMGMPSSACNFANICGKALALEHDGSVYSCDHYVYPDFLLGNVHQKPLEEMILAEKQVRFGLDKEDTLPRYCRQCRMKPLCNGECPKNRLLRTPDGEPGLNYLCTGLKKFLEHIEPWMLEAAARAARGS
jgi:uncharacterized protein